MLIDAQEINSFLLFVWPSDFQLENTVCLMARCISVGIGGGNHTTTVVAFPHMKFPTLSPREVEWR